MCLNGDCAVCKGDFREEEALVHYYGPSDLDYSSVVFREERKKD
jgi:hypothetical protein